MGAEPNAADCLLAPWLAFGLLNPDDFPPDHMIQMFARQLKIPERFERTIAWVRRMQAQDPLVRAKS